MTAGAAPAQSLPRARKRRRRMSLAARRSSQPREPSSTPRANSSCRSSLLRRELRFWHVYDCVAHSTLSMYTLKLRKKQENNGLASRNRRGGWLVNWSGLIKVRKRQSKVLDQHLVCPLIVKKSIYMSLETKMLKG